MKYFLKNSPPDESRVGLDSGQKGEEAGYTCKGFNFFALDSRNSYIQSIGLR